MKLNIDGAVEHSHSFTHSQDQPAMKGLRIVHRVKGRAALTRRLRGVMVAVHRFSRARAATREDRLWAGRMIAGLEQLCRIDSEVEK